MLTMEQYHHHHPQHDRSIDRCRQDSWTISQQQRQAALAALFLKFQSLDNNTAMTWQIGTIQKSIMTILTLTPTLLDEILDRSSALSLLVSIQSASSLLLSITHQLLLNRQKKHWTKRSKDVIRWETRAIVDRVQMVESLVTGGIMLNDRQLHAINESLVAHAHQLVDALLAFLNPSSHRLGSDQFAAQDASRSSADADSPAGKRLLRGIILPLKNQPMNNGIRMRTKPADDDSSDDTASLLSNSAKSSKSVQGFKKLFFGHRKQQQRIKKESLFHKRSKRHSGSTMDSTCSINSSSSSHPTVSPRWSHGSSVAGELPPTLTEHQSPTSTSKTQRISVQTLSSPSSRRTSIRMVDNHHQHAGDKDLIRSGYDQDENDKEAASDTLIPSDSCYFSVSSSSLTSFKTASEDSSSKMPTIKHTRTPPPPPPFETQHSKDNLVSIHIEHAEPTFISSTTTSRSSIRKASIPAVHKNFLRGYNHGNEGGLRHHRSESDLNRLKNLFTHHPSSNPSSSSISSTLKALVPSRSNSIKLAPSSSSASRPCQTSSIEQSPWSNIVRNLRRNQSSLSLNKKTSEENEILKQAGFSCSNHASVSSKDRQREGSILHVSENGQDVLIMEMVGGKLHVIAGTCEKLFLKLADETTQDLDYVDTYIMSHQYFTTSTEFLENLMARFHLEAQPGEADHFKKWQRCIQVKVLNVITRWIKLQYQDFEAMPILKTRLKAFLNGDIKRAGFATEAHTIREALDLQTARHARRRHSLVALTSSHPKSCTVPIGSPSPFLPPTPSSITSPRRLPQVSHPPPSSIISTACSPPSSPTSLSTGSASSIASHLAPSSPLLTFDSKDISHYLTLADFYIFKCITAYDYLHGPWRQSPAEQGHTEENGSVDYIAIMTQRANTLNRWVDYELANARQPKRQRVILKKLIEIAKLCLEWNNFHTSMVITMGLISTTTTTNSSSCSHQSEHPLQELLSYKDSATLERLKKNLDVGNNMAAYRQAFARVRAPAIPFFPIVLKDFTFYIDGNQTMLNPPLVNFEKFRALYKFANSITSLVNENYAFSGDLEHLAFFPGAQTVFGGGPLDPVAEAIESRLREVRDTTSNTCI